MKDRSAFARSFERAVGLSRAFGYLERAWDRAALPVGGVAGTFLAASWFGLWQNVAPSVRMAGTLLFAAALAAAIRPLFKVKYPDREDALERMNKANGGKRFASTYDDKPIDESDEQAKAMWELNRMRIERKVGKFKAGAPESNLVNRDPFALRFALALLTGISLVVANSKSEVDDRIAAAFDWSTDLRPNLAKLDAWVTSPDYTGAAPLYIASMQKNQVAQAQAEYTVAEGSVLTLRLHDEYARVAISGGTTQPEQSCRPSGKIRECQFEFSGNTAITVSSVRTGTVSWQFNVTPDLPPRIDIAPAPQGTADAQTPPGATYSVQDEYGGAQVTGGRVGVPAPRDPEAKPLPLFSLPTLTVPAK